MGSRSKAVSLTVADGLATIRMKRRHGNAINTDLVDGLRSTFLEAAGDDAVRGVLLTSAGKLFCPGLDLRELVQYDREQLDEFMTRFTSAMLTLYAFPKPLVAAISGHALAGGCVIAITADRRVLREGAMVGLNEVRVGVPLPWGVALMVRDSVHPSWLEEVALVGRNYSGAEAIAAGIVHEVHDRSGFEDHCRARLEEMASRGAAAFSTTKRYLRTPTVERIREREEQCRAEFLDCWFAPDTRKRIEKIVKDLEGKG